MQDKEDTWEGKSKFMFERMLEEVPDSVRDVFRGNLLAILREKSRGGPILEEHVKEVVNEKVPEPFKTNILRAFSIIGGVDTDKIVEIIERFPGGQESLLTILHAFQDQFGYCPEEALVLLSQKKGVPLSTLYRLVTTYRSFRLNPPKRYNITVCNGTGCYLKGGGSLLNEIEAHISGKENIITLEKVRCLGCCAQAPVLLLNGQFLSKSEAQKRILEILN